MALSESCEAIATCATTFVIAVAKLREEMGVRELNARIGVHAGSVVAGIIGHIMVRGAAAACTGDAAERMTGRVRVQPRYQLFGRAVDTVQAMERTSRAGECHASAAVVKELRTSANFVLYDQRNDGSAFVRSREDA